MQRTKAGHVAEVRLPEEIPAASEPGLLPLPGTDRLEEVDFLQNGALREALHARECGRCFYCLRQLKREEKCLDHVAPLAQFGRNRYRNLVSCCLECNSQKGEQSAEHFLQWLYRERRLTSAELSAQLRTLDALAEGKLRPEIEATR